jgi:hypothetical protein
MAHHWPVIVGINQYQSLQPLLFAQFDAVELKDFLINEAGLPPEQCSLLTDIAPMVYQGAAFPTREVILQRLQQSCQRASENDTVWFFFSGYGMHWQGKDYLLPIDADPTKLEQTAIPIESIFALLQQSSARQRLLMLDMNRSQSALPNQRLGVTTMEMAKQLEISLLLSCRPNQFSQETLAVRHGLFTEAILEGLRFHGCLTLSQLATYLNDRLPELCQHHFRPEQNPVSVIPTQQQFLMLVPPQAVGRMSAPPPAVDASGYGNLGASYGDLGSMAGSISTAPVEVPAESNGMVPSEREVSPGRGAITPGAPVSLSEPEPELTSAPLTDSKVETEAEPAEVAEVTGTGWQRWLLVGAGMLLLGVLLRNQSTFLGTRQPEAEQPSTVESVEDPAASAEATPPMEAEAGTEPAPSGQETNPTGEPLFPVPGESLNPQTAFEQARTAVEQRRFGEALNWLSQIPEGQRPEGYVALQEQAQAGYAAAERGGEAVLKSARRIIEPISASLFNDAIEEARQVPVGDEFYDQAQADIARWSRVILDLAQGRAANGGFDDAIAAAALVPEDQGDIYAQAQAEIQNWQQQKINRQLLQDAQSRLQPDQATSFEEAIKIVQQIPPGNPEYDIAQQRIDQWSQDILVIARARAADGQLPGAIAAAELVPPDTSAYDQAQEEIRRWQGQPVQ